MQPTEANFHYVCTLDEAHSIVDEFDEYWVSNCECREKRGPCDREAGLFLCLQFKETTGATGSGKRLVSKQKVLEVLAEAKERLLVPRPFRDEASKTETDGICFCCECCCDYFVKKGEHRSDKGAFIETTDGAICENCGTCEEVCYFGARAFDGEILEVNQDECYGCGLCVEVCPEGALEMILRT